MERQKKVKQKDIKARNLLLLRSPHTETFGKLEPKWIGPFLVTEKIIPGSFHLTDTKGRALEHSWNANNIRHFYI
jgi:hypothetical protein